MMSVAMWYFSSLAALRRISAKRSILGFGQAAVADSVFRRPKTVRRVCLDNAGLHRISEDAAEQTNGSRRRSSAASHDGLSTQLETSNNY